MKKLLIAFFCVSCLGSYGQMMKISGEVEKKEYKRNEPITIQYVATMNVDSVVNDDFSEFSKVQKGYKRITNNVINGVQNIKVIYRYILESDKIGIYNIVSPIFYRDGISYVANSIEVIILDEKMNKEDWHDIKVRTFRERAKPKETIRYTFLDNLGYIEYFDGVEWFFLRNLTAKEIRSLKKK